MFSLPGLYGWNLLARCFKCSIWAIISACQTELCPLLPSMSCSWCSPDPHARLLQCIICFSTFTTWPLVTVDALSIGLSALSLAGMLLSVTVATSHTYPTQTHTFCFLLCCPSLAEWEPLWWCPFFHIPYCACLRKACSLYWESDTNAFCGMWIPIVFTASLLLLESFWDICAGLPPSAL